MNKELLLKDGLLFLVFGLSSTATLMLGSAEANKLWIGLSLYGLATILIGLRAWLKAK